MSEILYYDILTLMANKDIASEQLCNEITKVMALKLL